jgi:hypothetical protein
MNCRRPTVVFEQGDETRHERIDESLKVRLCD